MRLLVALAALAAAATASALPSPSAGAPAGRRLSAFNPHRPHGSARGLGHRTREVSACKRAGCGACGNWPRDNLGAGSSRAALDRSPRERRYFDGVLAECGCSPNDNFGCKNFIQHYLAYARYHRAVTDNDPRVSSTARVLVVENAWRTYGVGHMAPTAARWLIFGMVSGRVVYFANEAEWDWQDYFEAYLGDGIGGGLDTRWTPELAADFESREGMGDEAVFDFEEFNWDEVASCEVGNCTEVHNCRRGDDCPGQKELEFCARDTRDVWECAGCNKCILHALEHRRWIRVIANSIKPPNYHEEQEFMKPFVADFWHKSLEWGQRNAGYKRGKAVLETMVRGSRESTCQSCAMAMLFRPKMRLKFWREFMRDSPVAHARSLVLLMARSGYPEATSCFPDDTPMTEACIDETWRHPPCKDYISQWHIRLRTPSDPARKDYLQRGKEFLAHATLPEGFHASDFAPNASKVIHVLTDAPVLQDYLKSAYPEDVSVTPGRGVDPTNNIRRDQDFSRESARKVAIDLYVQAWSDADIHLSPSAYYSTGSELRFPKSVEVTRLSDSPESPDTWDADWFKSSAKARANLRDSFCATEPGGSVGKEMVVTRTASEAKASREGEEEEVHEDYTLEGDDGGAALKMEAESPSGNKDATVIVVDAPADARDSDPGDYDDLEHREGTFSKQKPRDTVPVRTEATGEHLTKRFGAQCAGGVPGFAAAARVPDRLPLVVVDAIQPLLEGGKTFIELHTDTGDLAACAQAYAGRVEVQVMSKHGKEEDQERNCRLIRKRKLKVTCHGVSGLNRYDVPNVDVYLMPARTYDRDECGFFENFRTIRTKLAQRMLGKSEAEVEALNDFSVLKGKSFVLAAFAGDEAVKVRWTLKDAGIRATNERTVPYDEEGAGGEGARVAGEVVLFELKMDDGGVVGRAKCSAADWKDRNGDGLA